MTIQEFAERIDKLSQHYKEISSHKAPIYSAEQKKLLFNAVKKMSALWLDNTINHFILNRRTPPMLKDYLEEMESAQSADFGFHQLPQGLVKPQDRNCEFCSGTGTALEDQPDGTRVAYRCNCSVGASIAPHDLFPVRRGAR